MRNAFGVNNSIAEIAKAGPKALLGDAVVAAGTGGGRARKAGKLYRITPPGPTRRAEFGRGFQGGAAGSRIVREMRRDSGGIRESNRVGRRLLGEYRTAAGRAQASSPHPNAFRTGERSGRGAEFYTRHAVPINTVATVAAGGAAAGAGVVADHRRARAKVRSESVSKGNKVGYALLGGAVAGSSLGLTEMERRLYNRIGANVGFGHPYRHPVRTIHAYSAANLRHSSQRLGGAAERLEGRAATASTPQKREYAALRVARTRDAQNRARWLSTVQNERAAGRGREGARSIGAYDENKAYTAPSTIGKRNISGTDRRDAFGVVR